MGPADELRATCGNCGADNYLPVALVNVTVVLVIEADPADCYYEVDWVCQLCGDHRLTPRVPSDAATSLWRGGATLYLHGLSTS